MEDKRQIIERIELKVDRAVSFLLSTECRNAITQEDSNEIDDTVRLLKKFRMDLPKLSTKRIKKQQTEIIGRLINLWCRLRETDH
jgi:hypothetical protein